MEANVIERDIRPSRNVSHTITGHVISLRWIATPKGGMVRIVGRELKIRAVRLPVEAKVEREK